MSKRVVVENIPMCINLGLSHDWRSHIGRATVFQDEETGRTKIEIDLDEEASEKLDNMIDIFDLKAIGFAGMKRDPRRRASDGRRDDRQEGG